MELNSVESSNIAAIGYAPDTGCMRVRFKDGKMYDYPGTSQNAYDALANSKSKGKHLAENFRKKGVRVADATMAMAIAVDAPPESPTRQSMTLNTVAEDACCNPHMAKVDLSMMKSFTCPDCGTRWEPEMIEDIRHWKAKCDVLLW